MERRIQPPRKCKKVREQQPERPQVVLLVESDQEIIERLARTRTTDELVYMRNYIMALLTVTAGPQYGEYCKAVMRITRALRLQDSLTVSQVE